jgi:plastocyanin
MKGYRGWKVVSYICLMALIWYGCSQEGEDSAPATDTVYISNMQFRPAEVWINQWDTIVWINNDIVSHDITEFPGRTWTSDTIAPGQSWKTTLGDSTSYFCSIHPTMKGKVSVRQ